jgi:catechol 2,3-dioxygenase-like lactoylglutathione lyase family enzyme
VSDLERALNFYCGVLGFELQQLWAHKPPSSPLADITTTSA